ncbi:MAG: glycosyltransferase [bacterium]|nr:glycosyltransferase [bacterium]
MSRHILILGVGPLPIYMTERLYGFGIRAWQFALPLLRAGHRVTLVTFEFGVHRENNLKVVYQQDPSLFGELEHVALPEPQPRTFNLILTRVEDLIQKKQPDAIVAAGSTISTNVASLLKCDLPMWMDMFGDLFAEIQAKSPFMKDMSGEMEYFHQIVSRVLLRGDRYSVVSEMQRGAAIGQLGLMGRLNRFTLGENLIHTIPCAFNGETSPVKRKAVIRGKKVSPADFVLLCSGGFNTWADVETLFQAVEGAMEKYRRIQCVVTGGAISGHHEEGFNRFRALIAKSPYESRFHLLGWVSNEDVTQITLESDLGLNIDLPIYESVLGSRNRILFWLQCGLPVLSTLTTEISYSLSQNGYITGADSGDAKQIEKKILELAANQAAAKARAIRARRFAYEFLSFEETVKPLLEWCAEPVHSSDNIEREVRKGQLFNRLDEYWHEWAYPQPQDESSRIIPRFTRPVIKTRPQGKSWWQRLWGV